MKEEEKALIIEEEDSLSEEMRRIRGEEGRRSRPSWSALSIMHYRRGCSYAPKVPTSRFELETFRM